MHLWFLFKFSLLILILSMFRMMLKACTARSRLTGKEETQDDLRRWSCTMWPPDFTTLAGQSTGQTVTCSFSPLQTTTATAPSSRSTNTSDASTPLEIYPLYWWVGKPAACWFNVIWQLQAFHFWMHVSIKQALGVPPSCWTQTTDTCQI